MSGMEIRRLEHGPQDEIVIFCPLESGFKVTVGGKEYTFEPFQLYRVERKFGRDLLMRAQQTYEMRKRQRAHEREEWGKRIKSASAYVQDTALQYCDENGNPRSPDIPKIPLLDIDSPQGKVEFEKWKTEQLKDGERVITSSQVEPPAKPEVVADGVGDGTNPSEREIEKPDPNWDYMQKFEYVKRWQDVTRMRPRAAWIHNEDMHEKLDAAVERTYEILCQKFQTGKPMEEDSGG